MQTSEQKSEAGRIGGRATSDKYGANHFSEIGRKGGKTTKARHGLDFYSTIGKKGGGVSRQLKRSSRDEQ